MTFGEPVDPAYVDFKEGFAAYLNGDYRTRWNVPQSEWLLYSVGEWALEEIPATPTQSGAKWDWDNSAKKIQWVAPNSFSWPDVFRNVTKAYDLLKARYPAAVWNPRDGSWRSARRLAQPRVPPKPTPPYTGLPQGALDRIARIDAAEAANLIDADQARRLRLEVVEEYV